MSDMTFAEKCRYWRENGMQLSPRISPAARRGGQGRDPNEDTSNNWEKGIARDERGVPILLPGTLDPMPIKTYVEHRRTVDEGIRFNRTQHPEEG